jgi:ferredoxin-type protein NapF
MVMSGNKALKPSAVKIAGKENMTTDDSKREFIVKSVIFGLSLAGITRKTFPQTGETAPGNIPNDKKYPVAPPGAGSLDHFNAHCTSCHLCVTACPTGVLQPSLFEYGFKGMMQPHMDYSKEYCNYECTKCGDVCPTNAITRLSVDDKKLTQMGIVHLNLDKCVVMTDNTACGSCSEHCPTQAVTMIPYSEGLTIPFIDTTYCIGCGACEYACPVTPYTAIYVDGNPVQKVAAAPVIKELDETTKDDFLF